MRIQFLGHACFTIQLDCGTHLLFDPYEVGGLRGALTYRALAIRPDVVILTHGHADHADLSWPLGNPTCVRHDFIDDRFSVSSIRVAHDEFGGNLRSGWVGMKLVEADGLRILHCGDLGERLTDDVIATLGKLDVLCLPVGGYFTLGPLAATELALGLNPRFVLPCHYRTSAADIETLLPVSRFTRRWPSQSVQHLEHLEIVTADGATDSSEPTVVVLRPKGLS